MNSPFAWKTTLNSGKHCLLANRLVNWPFFWFGAILETLPHLRGTWLLASERGSQVRLLHEPCGLMRSFRPNYLLTSGLVLHVTTGSSTSETQRNHKNDESRLDKLLWLKPRDSMG